MKGLGVSAGIALTWSYSLHSRDNHIEKKTAEDIEAELARCSAAREKAIQRLADRVDAAKGSIGESGDEIFEAQMLMLKDVFLWDEVSNQIRDAGASAQWAFSCAVDSRIEKLSQVDDEYLRERVLDLRDVKAQILEAMLDDSEEDRREIPEIGGIILFGREITPSQLLHFSLDIIKGLVMEEGGPTSHTVLLAKSLGIPCIVGALGSLEMASREKRAYIDGQTGEIVFSPDEELTERYNAYILEKTERSRLLEAFRGKATVTKDGRRIGLLCNIGLPEEAPLVIKADGEGVGLFRSELSMISMKHMPTEDEQFALYAQTVTQLKGRPLTVRTLDIGGDKPTEYLPMEREPNPYLGVRGIRFCLANPEIFMAQLAAILRAGMLGPVNVMLPMITAVSELREVKSLLELVEKDLCSRGVPFAAHLPLGIMIEVPSAAVMADVLIREADFFSIGTNDLTQYLCAADRGNAKTAALNNTCNPAVLRVIRSVVREAALAGKPVSICGQSAADPLLVPLWIAMGVTELSVVPPCVLELRKLISGIDVSLWAELLDRIMALSGADEVIDLLKLASSGAIFDII